MSLPSFGYLCCHNNGLALIDAPLNRLTEMITLTHWQTAHTETLNNNGIITFKEIPQIVPVNPPESASAVRLSGPFCGKTPPLLLLPDGYTESYGHPESLQDLDNYTCKDLKLLSGLSGSCSQNNFPEKTI